MGGGLVGLGPQVRQPLVAGSKKPPLRTKRGLFLPVATGKLHLGFRGFHARFIGPVTEVGRAISLHGAGGGFGHLILLVAHVRGTVSLHFGAG